MNINRDNYETFFLLYIDNELSVEERNAVTIFVHENPDLQQEFEVLAQSILQPEPVAYLNKSKLLKKESKTVEIEENLLLYIDKELDKNKTNQLEFLLKTDKIIAAELAILKQTKLTPDKDIVFINKQSLYRKEETRVIPFGWWKLAAAAIFAGFGIWGTVTYFNSAAKPVAIEIAVNKKQNSPAIINLTTPTIATFKNNSLLPSPSAQRSIVKVNFIKKPVKKVLNKEDKQLNKIKKQVAEIQENTIAQLKKIDATPSNHLPKPYFDNSLKSKDEQIAVVDVKPQQTQINKSENHQKEGKKNIFTTASFSDNDTDKKEDHFKFSDEEPKKSKLTSFIREAKRKLERITNIQSGDANLKVANLSFATH